MSRSVLAIGLNASLVKYLSQFLHISSLKDAERLLSKTEINTIILDAKITSCVLNDTMRLLASTPVTTGLTLITSETDNEDTYSELGIEVLSSPAHHQALFSIVQTDDHLGPPRFRK